MTNLRPYQIDGIAAIDAAIAAGKRSPLLVSPTGPARP